MSTATAVAPLTTAEAEALVMAAHQAAEAAGVTVSVTVLDAGGHLLAFRRDDRAVLISGETSIRKAFTALQLNTPTADLVDAVQPGGVFHTLPTALDRPLLFIAGVSPSSVAAVRSARSASEAVHRSRTTPSPRLPWTPSSRACGARSAYAGSRHLREPASWCPEGVSLPRPSQGRTFGPSRRVAP